MKQSPIAASIEVCIGFSGVASAQAPACNSPSHRAFDFWIGVWQVRAANGKLADANSITKAHGGCVLRKQCRTPDADSGESLNIYDASRKLWHQTWTDSSGLLLILEGGSPDGKIVLEGKGFDAAGAPISHRITWSPKHRRLRAPAPGKRQHSGPVDDRVRRDVHTKVRRRSTSNFARA